MTETKKTPAVGIDLGTTFSAVAYLNSSGRPETIRNSEGDMTTPSAVFFDRKSTFVGVEAVEAGLMEPERLAQFAKRDVGEDKYDKLIRGESFPPEVIQALILRKLRSDAELKLGNVTKAVVTVPAFFNEPCRKATQDAGRMAGLEVLDIINEPTAAAITYGVEQEFLDSDGKSKQLERVLVYDLGGGTFDVTVMEIDKGNYHTVATAGDVYLGGLDWDRRIVDFIAEKFIEEHGVDPRDEGCGEQELLRKANQTKHALTQRESVAIAFAHEGDRLRTELSQREFATLTEDLVERTLMTVDLVLDDAALAWSDLTRLILVGGSTRMPMIRDELEKRSGMELDRSLSPDEAVSHGAALYAGMLLGHPGEHAKVSVTNVNSHDLGILAIDPSTGQPRRQIMIPRNSSLPANKSMSFKTHTDNQANVKIEVVEGGDDRGVNATKIGKCIVDDLPPKTPKGTRVEVLFDYSQDGRLMVSANLPTVERNVQMTMNRAAGLSSDEIKQWMERIDQGLGDPEKPVIDETIEADDQLLPDDDDEDLPFAIVTDDDAHSPGPVIKVGGAKKAPVKAGIPLINTGDDTAQPAKKVQPAKAKKVQPKKVQPAAKKPAVKKPVSAKPVSAKPAGKTPVKKLVKKPAVKANPLAEPPKKAPAAKKPVLKKPAAAKPAVKKPVVTKPAVKKVVKPADTKKPVKKLPKVAPAAPVIDVGDDAISAPIAVKPTDTGVSQLFGLDDGAPEKLDPNATNPTIDVGDAISAPINVSAADSGVSQLMNLGDGAPAPPMKMNTPFVIQTDDAGDKKKPGWKKRGKKLSTNGDDE